MNKSFLIRNNRVCGINFSWHIYAIKGQFKALLLSFHLLYFQIENDHKVQFNHQMAQSVTILIYLIFFTVFHSLFVCLIFFFFFSFSRYSFSLYLCIYVSLSCCARIRFINIIFQMYNSCDIVVIRLRKIYAHWLFSFSLSLSLARSLPLNLLFLFVQLWWAHMCPALKNNTSYCDVKCELD